MRVTAPTVAALLIAAVLSAALAPVPAGAQDGADDPVREGPQRLDPRNHRIGDLLPDFEFTDIDGESGRLSDYADRDAVVIAMVDTGCPLCKKYGPRLAELQRRYDADAGVAWLLLNINPGDDEDEIRADIERYGFTGRYIHDPSERIARLLGAFRTTDVFVVDAGRTLRYRGAVDDQYGLGYVLPEPRRHYLVPALEAVLDGRPVAEPATSAPGCELMLREAPEGDGDDEPEVTWHNRVSRIVQDNCQECHRDGQAAPFPLVTWDDVRGRKGMIRRMVSRDLMPPWFANPEHGEWANDRSLAPDDKADLLAWIENGCPEGDPDDAPVPMNWPEGWLMGEPDVVLDIGRDVTVPAEGVVPYKYFTVETELEEDTWVRSFEIRPSAVEQVHHVLVFLVWPEDHPRRDERRRMNGGLNGYFVGMVPGQWGTTYPENTGKFLPAGARLRFQVHYTTNGEEVVDRTRLGLTLCDEKPLYEVESRGISNAVFEIPPGADNHEVKGRTRFREPGRILSFMPHMHVRGKAFRYLLERPDGDEEVVLDVPHYDFNWQLQYVLRDPIDVEPGTKLTAIGWFDNSADNPANPDPSKTVRFGEQTWEEMMIGYVDWIPLGGDD